MIEKIEVGKKYLSDGMVVKIVSKMPEEYLMEYEDGGALAVSWPDVKPYLEEIEPEPRPEPSPKSLEEEIEEKYSDYDVYMFEWVSHVPSIDAMITRSFSFWKTKIFNSGIYPSDCFFVKGFHKFIFDGEDGLIASDLPYWGISEGAPKLPVAVLFKKEK